MKVKDKAGKITLDIYSKILELRKLTNKGIKINIERQTLLDLSESLKRLSSNNSFLDNK